jgi:Tol biopolymer transport system component
LSYARNLGGIGGAHTYVRDLTERRTTLVTVLPDGSPSQYESYAPTISDDGRFVLFASSDQRLSGIDRSGLFVRDLAGSRRTGSTGRRRTTSRRRSRPTAASSPSSGSTRSAPGRSPTARLSW